MLSRPTRFAKRLRHRLAHAANQRCRRVPQPAHSNLVTGTLADRPGSRAGLLAENARLGQQLVVLHRQTKTPGLSWRDRLSVLLLTACRSNWKSILHSLQPETLLRWRPHSPAPASGAGVRAGQGSRRLSAVLAVDVAPPQPGRPTRGPDH